MILSESKVIVPGQQYKVRMKCVSTRRLTAIEWLILTCVRKFENDSEMANRTIHYAFEQVFHFQNSELLIKPCLIRLQELRVIRIQGEANFDYSTLKFSDIELTDLGEKMLRDGLLPGNSREIPLNIYYNPLTGKVSSADNSITDRNGAIEFGTESQYNLFFPEESIINELQTGAIGRGKFTASKYRIEEIENLTSVGWECISIMAVDADENGELSTIPQITEDNMKGKVGSLLLSREINEKLVELLPDKAEIKVANIIGSGNSIKSAFFSVCENGQTLILNTRIYNAYKRRSSIFKNKTLILLGNEDGFSIDNSTGIFIGIPDVFLKGVCAALNEKGEHIGICRADYNYEGYNVRAPLAVECRALVQDAVHVFSKWLSEVVLKHVSDEPRYAALLHLPFMGQENCEIPQEYYRKWNDSSLDEILGDIESIQKCCIEIRVPKFEVENYLDSLLARLDFSDKKQALEIAHRIISMKEQQLQQNIIEGIIDKAGTPENYAELLTLLTTLGIRSAENALMLDDYVPKFYSDLVIRDIIIAIVEDRYQALPELFEIDSVFNDYAECLNQIEKHVSGFDYFKKQNKDQIEKSVKACPDLGALQSHMAQLSAKRAELMAIGINTYDVVRNYNAEIADLFLENSELLEGLVSRQVSEVLDEETAEIGLEAEKTETEAKKNMYILDTCALIHHPDIFCYFTDDEYVRIPIKVVDELGKIKDKRSKKYPAEVSETARELARDIERNYIPLFNKETRLRLYIENSDTTLLPAGLDPTVPDNQILSVALKYKEWNTCIISDDGVFRLASMGQNIHTMSSEEFIESHKESYVSVQDRIQIHNGRPMTQKQANDDGQKDSKNQGNSDGNENLEQKIDTTIELESSEIDNYPIKVLREYVNGFGQQEIQYLNTNKIRTIGDFRKLTDERLRSMSTKKQQSIIKNKIAGILARKEEILANIAKNIT